MKVLMVSSNTAVSPYPLYPLGCSMVAAALKGAGHEVRQFDFLKEGESLDAFSEAVSAFGPELIGISVRNIDNVNYLGEKRYIESVKGIVRKAREATKAAIVLGGAGFSLMPDLILDATGADYGIAGEGESLMVEFAASAARGVFPARRVLGPLKKLSGGGIPSALYDAELMEYYLSSGNIASVQTKRGCAHRCVYCSYPLLEGRRLRARDPVKVVDDIELLKEEHGVKYVFFIDSVFNDSGGTYLDVIREMKKRKVSVPWTAFFRPRGLDDATVGLMKETGLVAAEIGSDAATDETLRAMRKGFRFKDIERCNGLFVSHGISAAHFYVFGGPGETPETVREGIDNIKGLKNCVHFIYLGIRVLPNTALEGIARREGMVKEGDGLLNPVYYFSPHVDREWMHQALTDAFKGERHCIYPPDAMDDKLRMLHRLGYSGPMWDLLMSAKNAFKRGAAVGQTGA